MPGFWAFSRFNRRAAPSRSQAPVWERGFLDQFKYHRAKHKTTSDYQFWQEGSHPQQIQNEEMMRQKLDYIHYNPVKREFVDDPTHWRLSSARNYAGQEGLLPVTTEW